MSARAGAAPADGRHRRQQPRSPTASCRTRRWPSRPRSTRFNGAAAGAVAVRGRRHRRRRPWPSPDTILTELRTADVGRDTTAAGDRRRSTTGSPRAAASRPTGYTGSTTSLAPFRVGEGTEVRVDVRADDPAVRDDAEGPGHGRAAETGGPLDGASAERLALAKAARGRALIANQPDLCGAAGAGGLGDRRAIERADTRNVAERDGARRSRATSSRRSTHSRTPRRCRRSRRSSRPSMR